VLIQIICCGYHNGKELAHQAGEGKSLVLDSSKPTEADGSLVSEGGRKTLLIL
jgi:hypothetical protein